MVICCGSRICRLNNNVIPCLEALVIPTCIINRFPGCHADIVSRSHAPADAGEGAGCSSNRNVMSRIGVSQQVHVLIGSQHKVALGAVPAKDLYFFVIVIRIPYQNFQVSVFAEIGKLRIPANACPQTCHEGIVFCSGIVGHSFDTAVNLSTAVQGVSQEDAKRIVLTFHRHAFSAVCLHHRRINLHARGFLNGAARLDDKCIVRFYHFGHIIVVSIFEYWQLFPGRHVAVDSHVPADRRKIHVVGCRQFLACLQTAVGFQRDIAFGVRSIAIRLKIRDGLEQAFGFAVFYCNISIDRGLDGKHQLVRTVLNRNTALDARIRIGASNRNGFELVLRALQIHALSTDSGNTLRLNARCCALLYACIGRSQHYVLICFYICGDCHGVLSRCGHVPFLRSYCAINCYAACFRAQCHSILCRRFFFYCNVACVRSKNDRALCHRYSCIDRHIVLGSCVNITCYCRYGIIGSNRADCARKRHIVLRLYCAIGFHISISRCGNASCFRDYSTIDCNRAVRARKARIISCCNLAICLQASVRFQRDVAFSTLSVTFCMKFRADQQHAFSFFVFYRNIAIDHGLDREN